MKDAPRQQFRSAAHVSGAANVKPKDYEAAAEVQADNEYAAWALLRATDQPLSVGDLLEYVGQALSPAADTPALMPTLTPARMSICKYVGFEEARWIVPEPVQASLPASAFPGAPDVPAQGSAQA